MLDRRLAQHSVLETFVDGLVIERNVAQLVVHARSDVGTQCVGKGVELRRVAHDDRRLAVAAAGNQRHGSDGRCQKDFFHGFILYKCLFLTPSDKDSASRAEKQTKSVNYRSYDQ